MSVRLRTLAGAALLVAALASPTSRALASELPGAGKPVFEKLLEIVDDPDQKAALQKLADDPQVYKQMLDALVKSWSARDDSLSKLIQDLHLEPKVLKAKGATNETVLGLNYSYERAMASRTIRKDTRDPLGLAFSLRAKGSVAADASKNPNNLLESGVDFSLFQAIGGVEPKVAVTPAFIMEKTRLAIEATKVDRTSPNFRADPRYQAAVSHFRNHVLPQALWRLAGSAKLESDQQFAQRQWTYGVNAALSVRDWRDESWVSWLNLPDYPFALLRGITDGAQPLFQPSGHAFPALIAGLDLVDPKDNKDRLAIDPDKSRYQRWRGEIAFKTKVAKLAGVEVWFSASYKIYEERGASAAIRAANQDRFDYTAARLDVGKIFVTYARGKLPLDRTSDKVYELGYKFSL